MRALFLSCRGAAVRAGNDKCVAAYGGDIALIGTRLTDPTTFEDIAWVVRGYKESLRKALHGARGVAERARVGTRRSKGATPVTRKDVLTIYCHN